MTLTIYFKTPLYLGTINYLSFQYAKPLTVLPYFSIQFSILRVFVILGVELVGCSMVVSKIYSFCNAVL